MTISYNIRFGMSFDSFPTTLSWRDLNIGLGLWFVLVQSGLWPSGIVGDIYILVLVYTCIVVYLSLILISVVMLGSRPHLIDQSLLPHRWKTTLLRSPTTLLPWRTSPCSYPLRTGWSWNSLSWDSLVQTHTCTHTCMSHSHLHTRHSYTLGSIFSMECLFNEKMAWKQKNTYCC